MRGLNFWQELQDPEVNMHFRHISKVETTRILDVGEKRQNLTEVAPCCWYSYSFSVMCHLYLLPPLYKHDYFGKYPKNTDTYPNLWASPKYRLDYKSQSKVRKAA